MACQKAIFNWICSSTLSTLIQIRTRTTALPVLSAKLPSLLTTINSIINLSNIYVFTGQSLGPSLYKSDVIANTPQGLVEILALEKKTNIISGVTIENLSNKNQNKQTIFSFSAQISHTVRYNRRF